MQYPSGFSTHDLDTCSLIEFAMMLPLYALVVLIWGSTWIALKMQLGLVPVELSIAYRFGLAAIVLFAWLLLSRQWRVPRGAASGVCHAAPPSRVCWVRGCACSV